MRILISSEAPMGHTGYSTQTSYIAKVFASLGHHIDFYAWANLHGGTLQSGDTTFYPMIGVQGTNAHWVADVAEADLLFTLQDLWPLPENYANDLKVPWMAYFPIDAEPLMEGIVTHAKKTDYNVVYSKFGARVMEDTHLPHFYVPHAIDTDIFSPVDTPDDKAKLREEYGFPRDAFVVSIVATNMGVPGRKAFGEMLEAFALFQRKHENALLYLHTNLHPVPPARGYPLILIAQRMDIPKKALLHVHQVNYAIGLPNEHVADIYRLSDVLLSPSMGEGFGLPIAEAQACGCAVITQDCSSMPELTKNGISIPKGQRAWRTVCDWQYTPRVDDIIDALEQTYTRSPDVVEFESQEGVKFIRENYSEDVVAVNYWAPLMRHVEHELARSDDGHRDDGQGPETAKVAVVEDSRV